MTINPLELLTWFYMTGQLDYIRDGMDRSSPDPDVKRAQSEFDLKYALTQKIVLEWTPHNEFMATEMGWVLSTVAHTGLYQIERLDEAGAFSTDANARQFVEALAKRGNETCQKALKILEVQSRAVYYEEDLLP